MSNQTPRAGGDELPEVDAVLAEALRTQGEPGVRALGLLRDTHRILTGTGLERPGEIAESCLRGAAEALLKLPGLPELSDAPDTKVGLKTVAQRLLNAVTGLPAFTQPAHIPGMSPLASQAAWDRVRSAAEVLQRELDRPSGGNHAGRAAEIAERLMGVKLGAAQEEALGVWGEVYHKASRTLHGRPAEVGRPALLYVQLLAAVRELLVPLPDRAARVLQLAALQHPGPEHARELARWADPRATAYFLRSRPAAAWLPLLEQHALHLLLADTRAGGAWPAAAFFEHVADTAPQTAAGWLAGHAEGVAAAGRPALNALLGLAARRTGLVAPALMRSVLARHVGTRPAGEPTDRREGRTLQLAAEWTCALPVPDRDRDWILIVERLLQAAIDAEHTADRLLTAAGESDKVAHARAGLIPGRWRGFIGDTDTLRRWISADVARMPQDLARRLLRELVTTAHPGDPGTGPHSSAPMIRAVTVSLLVRDVHLTDIDASRTVFHQDLDEVRPRARDPFGGPVLARAVLDLAAADADADVGLAARTAQWHKIAAAEGWLHDRIRATHLTARTPGRCLHEDLHEAPTSANWSAPEIQEWHAQAYELVEAVLAGYPAPETARLVEKVWRSCTPRATTTLQNQARSALGHPPAARAIEEALAQTADPTDSTKEPLASWLRVRDWSPVLPQKLCIGFAPLLAALRRIAPSSPPDPRRAGPPPEATKPTDLDGTDLKELTATHGPVTAAHTLAATADAVVREDLLHRLVIADPTVWTADVPAVLAALEAPALRAVYLTAVAEEAADRRDVLPEEGLAYAVAEALRLFSPAPGTLSPTGPTADEKARGLAEAALFGLLDEAWSRPAGPAVLGDLLPAALTHLHARIEPLTRPAASPATTSTSASNPPGGEAATHASRPNPAARALGCILDYVVTLAVRPGPAIPGDILDLLATVLTAGPDHPAVSAAFGPRLPDLYICLPDFTATHHAALTALNSSLTPAAAWLSNGPTHLPLLTALDRTALLEALRPDTGGPVEHLAHALTTDPHALGDPTDVLTRIAAGPGGPEAVSWLLQVIAWHLNPQQGGLLSRPFKLTQPPARPATPSELAAVTVVWRAALAADLPPGALGGAGYFADLDLDDAVWLPLARASAEHTPQPSPSVVAWRAAAHFGDRDALVLTTRLLTHPAPRWRTQDVLRPARALLQAAETMTDHPHIDPVLRLREALINTGEVDAAQPPARFHETRTELSIPD
ncbi:hypothetical protein AB0N95_36310 [Streptomyces microflavus]|uniref:hypothetical protein n=1 Tax=Streptomyces microflavus TaxID=1919 RepID=UPI00344965B7